MQPIYLSDGFHTSDMIIQNGVVDPTIAKVQYTALEYISTWLEQWPGTNSLTPTMGFVCQKCAPEVDQLNRNMKAVPFLVS